MGLNFYKTRNSLRLFKSKNYLLGVIIMAFPGLLLAQAPNISYPAIAPLNVGKAITPIIPNNSGGAVPANTYGQVTTLAGGGHLVPYNGAGTAASFANPNAVATDVNGNVYVAVARENLIRKIDPSGNVSTFAGSGNQGYADGIGATASFNQPCGVATDLAGNVYVADCFNSRIRKITPTGMVTTFAGSGNFAYSDGTGTAASFNQPRGVATDGTGNVYVADRYNNLIRKITPTGVVTTLAGSGNFGNADGTGKTASFDAPIGVATDAADNIYVADYDNSRIRKITPNGVVTTFAGSGSFAYADGTGTAASFYHPSGVATDAAGNVYVADNGNQRIRKISPAAVVTTLSGSGSTGNTDGTGTAASFYNPIGVATDAAGNVYVADAFNNVIRKVTPTGVVTTFAGSGQLGSIDGIGMEASFKGPSGVATDATGNVYVADASNNLIRKITSAGEVTNFAGNGNQGSVDGTGTGASFNNPNGVATDASGNVYVADEYNGKIRKINPAGVVTTLTGNRIGDPTGVATDATGNVYVADQGNNRILKITQAGVVTTFAGSGAASYADGTGKTASFNQPTGVATDVAGNVYVADKNNNRIRKITPTGVVTTLAGSFDYPNGVATDAAGIVYVADYFSNNIRMISPAGVVTTLAGSSSSGYADGIGTEASFNSPTGVAIDTAGNVYVADESNNLIRKISTTGYTISPGLPSGLSFDATTGTIGGTPIVVHNVSTYTITAYNPVGSSSTTISLIVQPLIAAPNISYPATQTYAINKAIAPLSPINSGGAVPASIYSQVNTFAGNTNGGYANGTGTAASFNQPSGVVTDAFGNIYIADYNNNLIRKIAPAGLVSTFAGNGNSGSTDGSSSSASFRGPTGLAIDAFGNILVADKYNNLIRKIDPNGNVTTLAGNINGGHADGQGTAASFNLPTGLTSDASGNIYVTDAGNNLIRKITPSGNVSTLAGSLTQGSSNGQGTAASFNNPTGIAMDVAGNIYVTDAGNNLIRKITSTGVVSTLAGGANTYGDGLGNVAGFNSPAGITIDVLGNIYVADAGNAQIRKISPAGMVTTFAGTGFFGSTDGVGKGASFTTPYGIAIDFTGNIYIGDRGNNLIRKINTTGYTISPNVPAGLSFDATTGSISGTPTDLSPATTYTVTAYNLGGSSANTFSLAIASISSDARLSNLVSSGGALTPSFSPTTTNYAQTLNFATSSITITPITNESHATVTVNGIAVTSGSASPSITLNNGNNTITTLVTAQDGITTQTYTLNVTKIVSLPATNYHTTITGETCIGSSNGSVSVKVDASFNYTAVLTGNGVNSTQKFTDSVNFANLPTGSYTLTFTIDGQANYSSSYTVNITQPQPLSVYATVNEAAGNIDLNLSGGSVYYIQLNNKTYITTESSFSVPMETGNNSLQVTTDRECQGIFTKVINPLYNISPYPMPFVSTLNLNLGNSNLATVGVRIYSANTGLQVFRADYQNQSGVLQLDLSKLQNGAYGLQLIINNTQKEFKIIK